MRKLLAISTCLLSIAGVGLVVEQETEKAEARDCPESGNFIILSDGSCVNLDSISDPDDDEEREGGPNCEDRINDTAAKLLECVTVSNVYKHLSAFQAIADENEGVRASGTPGYDATVDYIKDTLEEEGYDVELQAFTFEFFPLPTLARVEPAPAKNYQTGVFIGSGSGRIKRGTVIPVDLALGNSSWPADPSTSSSGCEVSDFDGLDFSGPNDIALIQRGSCFFSVKATNAEAAGAEAVIIFNQGNSPTRQDLIAGNASTLPDGSPSNLGIPVVGASFADGVDLSQSGSKILIVVDPPEDRITYNVIAELPSRSKGDVVMVGAHLDSVQEGPGIQDNGSGSAAILEVALQMSRARFDNTVRFAWWGAEELGLLGSQEYVDRLSESELQRIALYLNFDMIASPNYVYSIYDGDDSDGVGAGPGPEGSAEIEQLFESFYIDRDLPFKGTDFSGRSDYAAFIEFDIPAGGLFTGAEEIKTEEDVSLWGGTAGEQYDPCYHLACDTLENVSLEALDVNSDAVAFATLVTAKVNTRRRRVGAALRQSITDTGIDNIPLLSE
ncbi:MAG: M28 family peptidase [Leptolyngbyaceae cyanobacterium MO_188.B28]|nr:M28 family peptidase [Leptolyngbyaceae cyanobacterium MO_188.B28]